MRTLLVISATMLLIAPAAASMGVRERNVAYFLDALGMGEIPVGTATIHEGSASWTVSVEDALRRAAERAGDYDLSTPLPPPDPLRATASTDIWVIETGLGNCPTIHAQQETVGPYWAFGHYIWGPYAGAASSVESIRGEIIDWSWYITSQRYDGLGATIVGQSDFYCVSFFGFYIWFPFLSGVAYVNAEI